MSSFNKETQAFFALVRAGLWEQDAHLAPFGQIDYNKVYRLAEEQSVVGLVAAGVEHVVDAKVPQDVALSLAGSSLKLELQNKAMNGFVARLIEKLRKHGIYAILVKGQGVAQCYEKPLWRACGDVDLFLSDENYKKAKAVLTPLASFAEDEYIYRKHLGLLIDSFVVELHGRFYCGLSSKIERELDDIYKDTFFGGNVRSLHNNYVQVFMLSVENDIFYVFTHILQHFYKGGIGLRQVCDWCRLIWTYRDKMDSQLLEKRLLHSGLMSEWKAFAAFSVEYLGMPYETIPLYVSDKKWSKKADRIVSFIIEVGNFGHNRDMSYYSKKPYLIRKFISLGRRMGDLYRHAKIFPLNSFRFFPFILYGGLRLAVRGE